MDDRGGTLSSAPPEAFSPKNQQRHGTFSCQESNSSDKRRTFFRHSRFSSPSGFDPTFNHLVTEVSAKEKPPLLRFVTDSRQREK